MTVSIATDRPSRSPPIAPEFPASSTTDPKRVERWKDSGLSCKEFAAEAGLNPGTLTFMKWQLGKGAEGTSSEAPRPKRRKVVTTFVELPRSVADVTDARVEVVIGAMIVRVPHAVDSDTLRRVLEVIKALP